MIETDRLILRPFREADAAAFAAINADAQVRYWLGGAQTRTESDAALLRNIRHFEAHGFGFLAVERKADGVLIGMNGVRTSHADLPLDGAVEIGWRLARDCWGQGYATEASRAALAWGFAQFGFPEVIAMTAATNLRSQAVMRRLDMAEDPGRAFLHPGLAKDHPLRPHVVFSKGR